MKKLGVIILNWNGLDLLKKFIPTAVEFTVSDSRDLIVADNGSTDASVEWLEKEFPQVRIIALDRNYGFAEGYNRAIQAAEYEYVVLLNSDVEVTKGWWQPMLEFMEKHPQCGALQPKIMAYNDRSRFEYAGAAGGLLDTLGYPYCLGRLFDVTEADNGQYDLDGVELCWASGACLMTRRDLYLGLGGLDPRFFAHMEEIDLCCRILNRGYKIYAVPQSRVYHVGGASLAQGNPKKTYLNFRNNLLLLYKNLPAAQGRRKLFLRRLADTLAFGMFLLKGDFPNAKAVIKAHNDFRKMKKHYSPLESKEKIHFPGSDRNAIVARYLMRKKSLAPKGIPKT